jgi:hypothetical protein
MIALDWKSLVVPGTEALIDYGGTMDGFSKTYR